MYKLNPDLPLVWRTPTSLQFGVTTVVCTLTDLAVEYERLLSLLQKGFSDHSLPLLARECGLSLTAARSFLSDIEPALRETPRPQSVRIVLDGQGSFVDQLGNLLVQCGHRVVNASARSAGQTDLAIVVGNFAIAPHRTGDWLRRGIPHLTVCWSDSHVQISPALGTTPEPGADISRFPCAECLELHHRDVDEVWPTIASQVVDRPASSLTPLARYEVSTMLSRWISTPEQIPLTSESGIRMDTITGEREKVTYALHPDCACQALPRNVSVLGSSHGRFPAVPRREKVAVVPS
ncbi:hypothetical protein M2119_001471 [Aurantimicrobium minutum]|nr:hypothetical protein [Aurantimicrobium minutum]